MDIPQISETPRHWGIAMPGPGAWVNGLFIRKSLGRTVWGMHRPLLPVESAALKDGATNDLFPDSLHEARFELSKNLGQKCPIHRHSTCMPAPDF